MQKQGNKNLFNSFTFEELLCASLPTQGKYNFNQKHADRQAQAAGLLWQGLWHVLNPGMMGRKVYLIHNFSSHLRKTELCLLVHLRQLRTWLLAYRFGSGWMKRWVKYYKHTLQAYIMLTIPYKLHRRLSAMLLGLFSKLFQVFFCSNTYRLHSMTLHILHIVRHRFSQCNGRIPWGQIIHSLLV